MPRIQFWLVARAETDQGDGVYRLFMPMVSENHILKCSAQSQVDSD